MFRKDMDLRLGLIACTDGTRIINPTWSQESIQQLKNPTIPEINIAIEKLIRSGHAWIFFWDNTTCELPEKSAIIDMINNTRADVLHNTPHAYSHQLRQLLISIDPLHLFYSHVDDAIKTISWESTFGLMLIRASLFHDVGTFLPHFSSRAASTLAWGRQASRQGAIMEEEPKLPKPTLNKELTYRDIFSIIKYISGLKWMIWAAVYACLRHPIHIFKIVFSLRDIHQEIPISFHRDHPLQSTNKNQDTIENMGISVVIPSLHRYKNLETTLICIANQTVKAIEIIIVDQESDHAKVRDILNKFSNLPLRIISLADPGQCRSRNAGIVSSTQQFIMLMDDDIEVPDNLFENLSRRLKETSADAVCGIHHEITAAPSGNLRGQILASDVMPGGNVLIRRSILEKSGLFDLAYDRLSRADADLAFRIRQQGGLIIVDRNIAIIHHHESHGGLRIFGARNVTNAISRRSYFKRNLLSPSEIYLAKRFFLQNASRCLIIQRLLATLYVTNHPHPLLRCLAGIISLPFSIIATWHTWWLGKKLLSTYPKIPMLSNRA